MGFEYLHGSRLHNIPGQPVPVFDQPHRKKRIVFFCSDRHINHLVPIVSCPVSGQQSGSPFSYKCRKAFFPGTWVEMCVGCSEYLDWVRAQGCAEWAGAGASTCPRPYAVLAACTGLPWPRQLWRQKRAAASQAQPGSSRKPDHAALIRAGLTTTKCLLIKGCVTQIVYRLSQIQTRHLLSSSLIWQTGLLQVKGLKGVWRSRTVP